MECDQQISVDTLPINNSTGPELVERQAGYSSLPENLYLFDERNRAFLEYRSTEVYPHSNPLVDRLLRAIIPAAAIGLALLLLLSLVNSTRQALSTTGASPLTLFLAVVGVVGIIVVIVSAATLYAKSLRMAEQDRELLVREGKVIFVPVEKCTLIRFFWTRRSMQEPTMRVRFSFVSTRSGRTLTRSFTTGWPAYGRCLAVGTPIAILFLNYKNYRVL